MKIDLPMIKKFILILSFLLILFTIFFFTCFGCFLVLNDSTSLAAKTVTLSSKGAANETYPDGMGEYQLAEDHSDDVSLTVYNWYRHVDREDKFLMYNNLGNMNFIICKTYNI